MNRLNLIKNQLVPACTAAGKSDEDIVIVAYARTPLAKAKRGSFKDTAYEYLLSCVIQELLKRSGLEAGQIEDVCVGNTLVIGSGHINARMGQFLGGLPDTTSLKVTNRLCSSGLESISQIAAAIKSGYIKIGIGAGVEVMSKGDMNAIVDPNLLCEPVFEHEQARNCLLSMGMTSENVAAKYGIPREVQDKMAVESHAKAARAQEAGLFDEEIVPVKTTIVDKDGNQKEIIVSKDEGIRKSTTMETLGKLKPAFKKGGSTTAGNASQVTDGAAGVILMARSTARELGLKPLACFRSYAVKGVPPEIMGIGPAAAIPAALEKANLGMNDIDIFEINEAFASQATYCVEKLGVPREKLNPKGGAIALGHPLGCTGSRMMCTLLPELKRTNKKYGIISMCIGTGMGAAAVVENEQ